MEAIRVYEELLRRAYGAINARNADAALALMEPAVRWANGNDGFVRGQGGLREYWRRQWQENDPRFEPLSFGDAPGRKVLVEVWRRSVRGEVIEEVSQEHLFTLRDGLIASMELGPVRAAVCIDRGPRLENSR